MKQLLFFLLLVVLVGCKKEDIDKDGCSLKVVNTTKETISYTLQYGYEGSFDSGSVEPGETVWHDVSCREESNDPDPSSSSYKIIARNGKTYRSQKSKGTPQTFIIRCDW